jgi:hypothetical protein
MYDCGECLFQWVDYFCCCGKRLRLVDTCTELHQLALDIDSDRTEIQIISTNEPKRFGYAVCSGPSGKLETR